MILELFHVNGRNLSLCQSLNKNMQTAPIITEERPLQVSKVYTHFLNRTLTTWAEQEEKK